MFDSILSPTRHFLATAVRKSYGNRTFPRVAADEAHVQHRRESGVQLEAQQFSGRPACGSQHDETVPPRQFHAGHGVGGSRKRFGRHRHFERVAAGATGDRVCSQRHPEGLVGRGSSGRVPSLQFESRVVVAFAAVFGGRQHRRVMAVRRRLAAVD